VRYSSGHTKEYTCVGLIVVSPLSRLTSTGTASASHSRAHPRRGGWTKVAPFGSYSTCARRHPRVEGLALKTALHATQGHRIHA